MCWLFGHKRGKWVPHACPVICPRCGRWASTFDSDPFVDLDLIVVLTLFLGLVGLTAMFLWS